MPLFCFTMLGAILLCDQQRVGQMYMDSKQLSAYSLKLPALATSTLDLST